MPPEPPPLRIAPPPLDAARTAETLRSLVVARCGRLTVRYVEGDAVDATGGGNAVLVLQLEPSRGGVRVVDSVVHSPGRARPALVSCAQWALRGAELPAVGVTPGGTMQALVVVGVPKRSGSAESEQER